MADALTVLALLIELHAADGSPIVINTNEVISMRGPRASDGTGQLFSGNAHCLINTSDGKYLTTKETCAQVMRVFVESEKNHEDICGACKEGKPP